VKQGASPIRRKTDQGRPSDRPGLYIRWGIVFPLLLALWGLVGEGSTALFEKALTVISYHQQELDRAD
jgi:hypothetical protein